MSTQYFTEIQNVGRVKSSVDDLIWTGYCTHESSLCATICWGSASVRRFVQGRVHVKLDVFFGTQTSWPVTDVPAIHHPPQFTLYYILYFPTEKWITPPCCFSVMCMEYIHIPVATILPPEPIPLGEELEGAKRHRSFVISPLCIYIIISYTSFFAFVRIRKKDVVGYNNI